MTRRLFGLAALAGMAALLATTLGMQHGILLSSGVKSMCWPWAPSFSAPRLQAETLTDPVWQFVPWVEFARRELLAGRLPLWNPHQDGGVPLLGNSQSALGSPLLWPALAFGVAGGWNVSLLLRLLVALAGTFLWLRDRGRSLPAAALGGVAFALSGPFVAWLEHPQTLTAAPLPFLLLAVGRCAERTSARSLAFVALTTALVLSGGHPEISLMAAFLATATLASSCRRTTDLLSPVAGALLGAGLSLPLLLPFIEYYLGSAARFGADRAPSVLPRSALVRFLLPGAPGSHSIAAAATVSLAVLMLVPFAFLARGRARQNLIWAGTAVTLLVLAYDNPLARLAARITPVYWIRGLLLLPLALAFLASAGLDALLERAHRAGREPVALALAWGLAAAALVELLLASRGVHAHTPSSELTITTPLIRRLQADPEPFHILGLHTFLPPNTATDYGLDDLRGYDALAPRHFRKEREALGRFRSVSTQSDVLEPWDLAPGGQALDFWNVKYLLLHPQFRFDAETMNARLGLDLEQVYSGPDGRILQNRRVLPRIRFADAAPGQDRITLLERTPTRWRFTVQCTHPRPVLIANPAFPGWNARIDGQASSTAWRRGSPMWVEVPAGRHEVELVYEPLSFRLGVLVSLASGAALLVMLRRRPVGPVRTATSAAEA